MIDDYYDADLAMTSNHRVWGGLFQTKRDCTSVRISSCGQADGSSGRKIDVCDDCEGGVDWDAKRNMIKWAGGGLDR